MGPIAPVAPWGPCGPVGPVGPWGPVGPVGPCGPVGPKHTRVLQPQPQPQLPSVLPQPNTDVQPEERFVVFKQFAIESPIFSYSGQVDPPHPMLQIKKAYRFSGTPFQIQFKLCTPFSTRGTSAATPRRRKPPSGNSAARPPQAYKESARSAVP